MECPGEIARMIRDSKLSGILLIGFLFFPMSGCSIWESYPYPNNSSARAERICHPFMDCSQGQWVNSDGSAFGAEENKKHCEELTDAQHDSPWWGTSISRGLEVNRCMQKEGYTLKQKQF